MLLISDHSMLSDFRHLMIFVESQWSSIKLADFFVFPYISCASSLVLTHRGRKSYYSHPSFSLLSRTIFFLPKACADCFCCHLGFCATDSFLLLSDLSRRRAALRGQRSMVAVSLNFLQRQSKASKSGQTFIIYGVWCRCCIKMFFNLLRIPNAAIIWLLMRTKLTQTPKQKQKMYKYGLLHCWAQVAAGSVSQ